MLERIAKITNRTLCFITLLMLLFTSKELLCQIKLDTTKVKYIDVKKGNNFILSDKIHVDSVYMISQQKLRRSLDSLKLTSKFKRLFLSSITTNDPYTGMLKKSSIYDKFEGEVIDTIFFDINEPFEENKKNKSSAWLSKTANNLHVRTKYRTIQKYILFNSGDTISAAVMERNEYIIRALSFISNAYFLIEPTTNNRVNVIVYVEDNFSIGASIDYKGFSSDSYISIYEGNFLGRGDKLSIRDRYNLDDKDLFLSGDIGYEFSNVFGSFYNLRGELGIGRDYYNILFESRKEFIKPTDYAGGAKYENSQNNQKMNVLDTTLNVRSETMYLWGGKSFKIAPNDMSLFFTVKAEKMTYMDAPVKNKYYNPYYHNRRSVIASIGIYNEHFYRGNLIYGYGYTEDIPYGYKAELIGGYTWSQYRNMPYVGLSAAWGFRNKFGYYNINIEAGSYLKGIATMERTIVNGELFGFTNLISLGKRYDARIFIRLNYNNGFNMLSGERQRTWFMGTNRIKGASIRSEMTTKMYASPEFVLFTPWSFAGFRFAPYSYLDMGTLGEIQNPFKNRFYSSIGIGVRIRNQTLIFPTIQIRFSVLLRGYDDTKAGFIELGNEPKLRATRFIPYEPQFIEFK